MSDRWVVLQEDRRRRFGGDLRRAFVLRGLATRTDAVTAGWGEAEVEAAVHKASRRRLPWSRRARPLLASAEVLSPRLLAFVEQAARPAVLDIHDDPLAQLDALGMSVAPERRAALAGQAARNRSAFPLLLAPTATFASLAGLAADRTLVAPNGTDTRHIRPLPLPTSPAIGFASGAAPNRGIEMLVDVARIVRRRHSGLRLLLWLVATGEASAGYLAALGQALAGEPWIEVATTRYAQLGSELARATVFAIPHPPGLYFDSALPIKLLDAMAAGRPVAVTPRTETAGVVAKHDAGLVAVGDSPDDLAAAIDRLLSDDGLAARMGANGRRGAEKHFDWRVIGAAVADEVLARMG